jgi:hypothetical protein
MHKGCVNKIHILSQASKGFILTVVPLLQTLNMIKKEYIYMCDEIPQDSKINLTKFTLLLVVVLDFSRVMI